MQAKGRGRRRRAIVCAVARAAWWLNVVRSAAADKAAVARCLGPRAVCRAFRAVALAIRVRALGFFSVWPLGQKFLTCVLQVRGGRYSKYRALDKCYGRGLQCALRFLATECIAMVLQYGSAALYQKCLTLRGQIPAGLKAATAWG